MNLDKIIESIENDTFVMIVNKGNVLEANNARYLKLDYYGNYELQTMQVEDNKLILYTK